MVLRYVDAETDIPASFLIGDWAFRRKGSSSLGKRRLEKLLGSD